MSQKRLTEFVVNPNVASAIMSRQEIEKQIARRYYWDVGFHTGVGYYEEHYQAGKPITLAQLNKALASELRGQKAYYKMSPKARRFGLWAGQGKLYRQKIKVLRELIKQKKALK